MIWYARGVDLVSNMQVHEQRRGWQEATSMERAKALSLAAF